MANNRYRFAGNQIITPADGPTADLPPSESFISIKFPFGSAPDRDAGGYFGPSRSANQCVTKEKVTGNFVSLLGALLKAFTAVTTARYRGPKINSNPFAWSIPAQTYPCPSWSVN